MEKGKEKKGIPKKMESVNVEGFVRLWFSYAV
jgi:hypothetical protein